MPAKIFDGMIHDVYSHCYSTMPVNPLVFCMQDQTYWDAWEASIDDTLAKLVGDRQGGIFVSDSYNGYLQQNMQHLVCFLPANVALGAQTGNLSETKKAAYMAFAEQLAETCWEMYNISVTGKHAVL